jgi:haloalkane dehalogenase
MPNVLLTGIIGPHGNLHFDLAGDRLTRDQDIFTVKSHFHYVALHFIAQNLSSPCVVLEHPELEDFEEELRKGYDFVGINFTMVNITKMIQMCDAVRRVAPGTQIILGGYGTSCFNTIFKGNTEIHKLADHVCYGEGVTFMRKLLGEPLDTPITQPVGPRGATGLPWLEPYPKGSGGHIVSGLGCQNMCEFCSTAAYYGGEYIELARADRLFEGMKQLWRIQPDSHDSVGIFDENLYKDKQKVTRLGELIRQDHEFGLSKMSYFSFGTIEDLSRYDVVEDLVMNGVGSIWIGVESLHTTLRKRQGRAVKDVFDDLHAHGITTIGSWIGGWDFHDKENIQPDLEHFISLEPTQSQLFPLFPPPGTNLYDRLVSEGRLPDPSLARSYFGRTSGSMFGFPDWKKNFTEEEISAIVETGHRRLYERAGPSLMRSLRVHLNGYDFCKNSEHEILREQRAELHRAHCLEAYPLIRVCEFFAPNERVRHGIEQIRKDWHRLFGEPSIRQQVLAGHAFMKGCLYKLQTVIGSPPPADQPLRRYAYERKPVRQGERPYVVDYPHPAERYETEQRIWQNEMKLVDRYVELLEEGRSPARAEAPVRRFGALLDGLESLGHMAKLVDDLGDDVGLSKGWLRSEVMKRIEVSDDVSREDLLAAQGVRPAAGGQPEIRR